MKLFFLALSIVLAVLTNADAAVSLIPVETLSAQFKVNCASGKQNIKFEHLNARVDEQTAFTQGKESILSSLQVLNQNEVHLAGNGKNVRIGTLEKAIAVDECYYHSTNIILDQRFELHLNGSKVRKSCDGGNPMELDGVKKKTIKSDLVLVDRDTQKALELVKMKHETYSSDICVTPLTVGKGIVTTIITVPFLFIFLLLGGGIC